MCSTVEGPGFKSRTGNSELSLAGFFSRLGNCRNGSQKSALRQVRSYSEDKTDLTSSGETRSPKNVNREQ